jgi:hypothetical protein
MTAWREPGTTARTTRRSEWGVLEVCVGAGLLQVAVLPSLLGVDTRKYAAV